MQSRPWWPLHKLIVCDFIVLIHCYLLLDMTSITQVNYVDKLATTRLFTYLNISFTCIFHRRRNKASYATPPSPNTLLQKFRKKNEMLSMKPNINKSRGKSVFLKPNDMFFLVRFESLDPHPRSSHSYFNFAQYLYDVKIYLYLKMH